MYITKIELENIKCFDHFVWELEEGEDPAGWHVILGSNGAGKSSIIRGAVSALMGAEDLLKLRVSFQNWITQIRDHAEIAVEGRIEPLFDSPKTKLEKFNAALSIDAATEGVVLLDESENFPSYSGGIKTGYFASSFGPYRRFTGGNESYKSLFESHKRLARHLSVFGEDVAFTEPLAWLKQLKFEELEESESKGGELLIKVLTFINENEFLPNGVVLDSVSSKGVLFLDSQQNKINIEDLSDGYRSVLSLMLELIRQLQQCFEAIDIFNNDCSQIIVPGVVFIDEIDVHLHPSWQRQIGHWLTKHFPRIQFIVTTHSALICQSAINGSVWKLPSVDGEDSGGRVTGIAFNRLVYGNLVEAYNSGAFGPNIERSELAQDMLEELAELNVQADFEPLGNEQKARQQELSAIFATNSNIKSR